ncbi:MAG: glycosyltransferase, partial [Bacteroidota bacterium]|nr:glycosyltransferase [Bacteroidota bacterium]
RKKTGFFNPTSSRIISIGNLVGFKTYNMHVIHALPKLIEIYPAITYDIYGLGPNEEFLRGLVKKLHLNDVVRFHGEVEYSKMENILRNSSIFIGSGTAILEAAALGVPAIIGIESIEEPLTYGYISEIKGLSYNENVPYVAKVAFNTLLVSFFGDSKLRESLSIKCQQKSEVFSVKKTVAGLENLNFHTNCQDKKLGRLELARMYFSFLGLALKQIIARDSRFSSRRNQSF